MKKINKKGFTIIELVIVIAVIAILCAVLIPTFISLAKKAKVSNDTVLVKNLNTILAMSEATDGKNVLMGDALTDVFDNGYVVANLTPTSEGYDIVWDSVNDRFRLYNGTTLVYSDEGQTKVATQVDLWKVYSEVPSIANQTYSIYLRDGASVSTADVKVGFDVGNNTNVTNINYANNIEQNVVIRTNSVQTSLTVNAPSDEITHYGKAGSIVIENVKPSSYTEKGEVVWLEITEGRLVLEEESNVEAVYIAKKSANAFADNVIIAIENGTNIPEFSRDVVEISAEGTKVCTIETDSEKMNIYLFQKGIYEQIQVEEVVNDNPTGIKNRIEQVDISSDTNRVAVDIANAITRNDNGEIIVNSVVAKVNENGIIVAKDEANNSLVTEETITAAIKETGKTQEQKNLEKEGLIDPELIIFNNGINTKYSLVQFRDEVNGGNSFEGCTVTLQKNIDLQGVSWDPIGSLVWYNNGASRPAYDTTQARPFSGIFDGNGYTISNMTIDDNSVANGIGASGFFGNATGATIQNLNFVGANVNLPNKELIGIVVGGVLGGDITVRNITIDQTSSLIACDNIGVIVGSAFGDYDVATATFDNIVSSASVSAENAAYMGMVTGSIKGYKTITFTRCTNNGDIKLTAAPTNTTYGMCGGIVGYLQGNQPRSGMSATTNNTTVQFVTCINNGEILGYNNAGGIVANILGANQLDKVYFTSCVNNGKVSLIQGGNTGSTGGMVGYTGSINGTYFDGCSNNGTIGTSVGKHSGGIFGWVSSDTEVKNCIIDGTIVASENNYFILGYKSSGTITYGVNNTNNTTLSNWLN